MAMHQKMPVFVKGLFLSYSIQWIVFIAMTLVVSVKFY